MEQIKSLIYDTLIKLFGETVIASPDELPAEFYKTGPAEYNGVLYPKGSFSTYDSINIGCSSVEFIDDAYIDDDTTVYAIYPDDMKLCYITIVENDAPIFCRCIFQ